MVIEDNASPSIEGGGVGVTVKYAGDDLVLSVAQDASEGAYDTYLTMFLWCLAFL